jgi:preprotein translocase subunit SecB
MSDTSNGDAAAAPATASLGIAQQYVKDLSFESPSSPKIFMSQMKQPDVNANFNVAATEVGEDLHEVVLTIEINAETDGEPVFVAELSYAGLCQVKSATPDVTRQALMIEVPRQLFPFARAVMADAIRDGGFPPLLLSPIDFNKLYQEHQKGSVGQTEIA